MKTRSALKQIDHQGIALAIDRPQGTVFGGTGADGKPYSVTQQDDYGFIVGVMGDDGEEYDVYVGCSARAASVYVVRQLKAGAYDEQKAMLGYDSPEQAEALYRAHTAPSMFGGIFAMSVAEFKRQLAAHKGTFVAVDTLHKESMTNEAADRSAPSAHTTGERPGGMLVRSAVVYSVRAAEREADFICSTECVDSYGEIVRQTWDLTRFNSNPVALWSHDSHGLPVGQWLPPRVEGKQLIATFKAATAAANPMAEHVWQSILEKTLRTVSVGFVSHKTSVEEVDGREVVVLDDNELFEISLTPLPANPEAVLLHVRAVEAYRASKTVVASPPPPPGICHTLGAVPFESYTPTDDKWNVSATIRRLRDYASDGKGKDHVDWVKYRAAFAWVDPQKTHDYQGFRYPHHDVKDGKLITPRAGVVAACAAFTRSNGGKMPDADRAAVKSHLQREAHACGLTAPWEAKSVAADAVDTLKTTQPHAGTKNTEARVAAKDDTEDAAKNKSMVTCPECGEKFDPEDEGDDKSKAAHVASFRAAVERKMGPIVAQLKAKVLDLTGAVDTVTVKHATALTDLASSKSANDALALKLVETELKPLSGVKFAPASYDGIVDLAKHYLSQGDVGAVKWQKHLDGLNGAPSLVLLGGSVLPKDQTPSGIAGKDAESGADLINAMAQAP